MIKKKTEDLIHEIEESTDITQYISENEEEFLDIPLHLYLKQLLAETGYKVSQITELSCKGEYIYQVFRGIKNPSRDVILSIALAMQLTCPKASQLLRIARMSALDARNRRDSVILFALSRKLSVPDTNDILYELGETCL